MSDRSLSSRIRLAVVRPRSERERRPRRATMPAWVASVGGALVVAFGGWLLTSAAVVGSWMSASAGPLTSTSEIGTRVWLLIHGRPASFGQARLTLVPLGASLVLAWLLFRVSAYAAKQARLTRTKRVAKHLAGRIAIATCGSVSLVYTGTVALTCLATSGTTEISRPLWGTLGVSVFATLLGAARGAEWDAAAALPAWARTIPTAVGRAVAVMLVGGLLLLVSGFVARWAQVVQLQQALGGGAVAVAAMAIVHLSYLPTFVLWGSSYLTAAGFTVGSETVVTMAGAKVGLLPALPIFALAPDNGPAPGWALCGMAIPVVAGLVAGVTVVRSQTKPRWDVSAVMGGLCGVAAGLAVTALCVLARGDLGSSRLAGMGPQLTELLVLAPSIMGLSGLLTGLVLGIAAPWWQKKMQQRADDSVTDAGA